MSKKQKIITFSILGAVLLIIVALIIAIINGFSSPKPPSPSPTPITGTDIIGVDQPIVTDTPIKDGIVPEEIINEPIVNTDRAEDVVIKDAFLDEVVQEVIPQTDDIVAFYNPWEYLDLYNAAYVEYWGYFWIQDRALHPETGMPMAYILKMPMYYKEDPNEKKAVSLYLYDCFIKEYSNILMENDMTQIKNLNDIPIEGIHVMGEKEDSYASLYLGAPNTNENSITMTLVITQKNYQLVRGLNMYLNEELDYLIKTLTQEDRRDELDIVIYNGGQYTPEKPIAGIDATDPHLTEADKTMLRMLGIPYTPIEEEVEKAPLPTPQIIEEIPEETPNPISSETPMPES